MKVATYHGPKDIRLEERPIPTPAPGEVIIKVSVCGICGSDLHMYKAGQPLPEGLLFGHEFSGSIAALGEGVHGVKVGDRVTLHRLAYCLNCPRCLEGNPHLCESGFGMAARVTGGFGEYARLPNARLGLNLFLLPPEVSDDEGAMIEPLSVAVHGVRVVSPGLSDKVAIFGAGTIGLCTLSVLKTMAATQVAVIDVAPARLALAAELGADLVINARERDPMAALAEWTGPGVRGQGAQVDIAVDCAGIPLTFNQALQAVRRGGKVLNLAVHEESVNIDVNALVLKELRLYGSLAYNGEYPTAIELVRSGKVNLKPFVTHRFPLEQIRPAFEQQLKAAEAVKVFVEP